MGWDVHSGRAFLVAEDDGNIELLRQLLQVVQAAS